MNTEETSTSIKPKVKVNAILVHASKCKFPLTLKVRYRLRGDLIANSWSCGDGIHNRQKKNPKNPNNNKIKFGFLNAIFQYISFHFIFLYYLLESGEQFCLLWTVLLRGLYSRDHFPTISISLRRRTLDYMII